MIDSTAQIYVQCNNTCLHSKPGTTKSLPPRAMLISARWQRKWNGPAHLCLCYQLSMICLCAIPAVVVIMRWWQCQPLGQPAAALAMWISQIKAGSNLLWSVRGNRWWRDKQLKSEIAQLIQAAITSRTKSHHRKLLQMLQIPFKAEMKQWAICSWLISHISGSNLVIDSNPYTCCQRGNVEVICLSSRNPLFTSLQVHIW